MPIGSRYRSKFEARCGKALGSGFVHEAIRLPYSIDHEYIPDFVDIANKIIIETKGRFRTPADRAKLLAVKKAHPQWRIVLWFQNPALTISKTSKTTYVEWALKHGFEVR